MGRAGPAGHAADLVVEVINRQRKHGVDAARVRRAARRAFTAAGGRGAAEVTILFTGERAIRRLNRQFRGVDRSTDVLSFPSGDSWPGEGVHLGDVAIWPAAAAEQAARSGRPLAWALDRLVIHGLLHLLGHDHETDEGEMMALQGRVLRALGRRTR